MLLLIVTVIPSLVLGKLQELRGEECEDGYIDCGARAELSPFSWVVLVVWDMGISARECNKD